MADGIQQLRELVLNTRAAAEPSPYPPVQVTAQSPGAHQYRVVDVTTGQPIPLVTAAGIGWYRQIAIGLDGKPMTCPCCGKVREVDVRADVRIEFAPELC